MDKLTFGKRLVEIRKANGLTQAELAEKCNVTSKTIQRIETGIVEPRAFTVKMLSSVLAYDFLEISKATSDVINKVNLHSNENANSLLFKIKDLFNLKINTMKKLSILTPAIILIGTALFFLIAETKAVEKESCKSSVTVVYNKDNSIERIEARFTNQLTFDSLTVIKNKLSTLGISICYRKILFDEKGHLEEIDCFIDCNDGNRGSFGVPLLNSANLNETRGFFRDYSKKAKVHFCTGGCGL